MSRTLRDRRDGKCETRWVLLGERGAIEYHALRFDEGPCTPLSITVHSPVPLCDGEPGYTGCDVLEGLCYPESGSLAASELHQRLEAAGGDEDVIWETLETWYRYEFGGSRR